MDIIDFRVTLRTPRALKSYVPKPIPQLERYVPLYNMKSRLTFQTPEETIAEMKAAGITKAVLPSKSMEGNEFVAEMAETYPEFIPIAGVSLDRGVAYAYNVLKNALRSGVFQGFNFAGLFQHPPMAIDDSKLYPLYALCVDHDVCAIVHSSLHYYLGGKLELNSIFRSDNVAVDFPELRLVLSHAGNGFGTLPLVLAQRHPHVYLDVNAVKPKHFPEAYITALNKYLKDKFIFGTCYPHFPFSIIEEWKTFVKEENRERFFYGNAMKALGKS